VFWHYQQWCSDGVLDRIMTELHGLVRAQVKKNHSILVDNGYHPDKIIPALEQIYPAIMTKLQFELSAKPSKAEKEAKRQSGFVPVAARWVIERSNAWVERCKSLVKNFDRTIERANAKLKLCLSRLMVKRLANG
jgi:transposase